MLVQCPHCFSLSWIEQINCGIFRHGSFIDGGFVPPHATKEECDQLINKGLVYGCMKPFQILTTGEVIICDYI
jgi:hypothetical protein